MKQVLKYGSFDKECERICRYLKPVIRARQTRQFNFPFFGRNVCRYKLYLRKMTHIDERPVSLLSIN